MILHRALINNNEIAYYLNSTSSETAIVFIHGNSMSSKIWQKQFESDKLNEFSLIAIDLLGCGNSSHSTKPDNDYLLNNLSGSIAQLLKQLNYKNYVLVGNSLGGNVCHQLINKLENLVALMSVGGPPVGVPPQVDKMLNPDVTALQNYFVADYSIDAITNLANTFFKTHNNTPSFFESDFIATDGQLRAGVLKSVVETKYDDELALIAASSIPFAFVKGANDDAMLSDYYTGFGASNIWKSNLIEVENSGHCPQWDSPKAFNELLHNFVTDSSR